MKKITLGLFALLTSFAVTAQDDCAGAVAVTAGTYTVAAIDGTGLPTTPCYSTAAASPAAEWYSYTATAEEVVTINTNLAANAGGDTRISVYTGACGSLECFTGNDDVDVFETNYLSQVQWIATAGETYYIVFDNRWSSAGFDFEVTTSTSIPTAAGVATNPIPADGAEDVALTVVQDEDGEDVNQVTLTWDAPTSGDAPTSYEVYVSTDGTINGDDYVGTSLDTSVDIPGFSADAEYFWLVYPLNASGGPANDQLEVWSFTTGTTAGLEDVVIDQFNFFYSKDNQTLNVSAESIIENVTVYSVLGQEVANNNFEDSNVSVNVSALNTGIFIAKVTADGKTKTVKFVKR